MNLMSGVIYMIPVTLGNCDTGLTIPAGVIDKTLSLRLFAVEEIRSARRYLRALDRSFPIDETLFFNIGKHSDSRELDSFFREVAEGRDAGVMSEAGMPGLADPGNIIVAGAHRLGIKVVPLTGPSSIVLALVASGLNGQGFAFHGYLPQDPEGRQKTLRDLEKASAGGQTQIFMETPFRAARLLNDIIDVCKPSTKLCIAADISLPTEDIRTLTISAWKEAKPNLEKRLAVFLLQV